MKTLIVVRLRALAWWVVDRWPDVREDRQQAWRLLTERKPLPDEIEAALRQAYRESGLSDEQFYPEFSLGPKRHEVLFHAARIVGNPIETLNDIRELLK